MPNAREMRAAIVDRYGPPEVIRLGELPIPEPDRGEVRIRVIVSTVNRTDTATLRGHPFFARAMTGLLRPKMQVLGMEFAGVVDALGEGASGLGVGERVFGLSPEMFGAHADYLCLPADGAIARIPDDLSFDEAVVAEGAWYANSTTKRLKPGQQCLIYGASGAIGIAALQLAKLRGAEVTAVVGTRHLQLAEKLGADRVVNYEEEDFTGLGRQFDLVMDAVGKTSWFACRPLLKPGGLYAATDLGPWWSNIVLGAWYGLTGSRRVSVPFPEDAPGFVRWLAGEMAEGRYRGVFDLDYPLDEIVEAFRYVEAGQKTGIARLRVAPSP